MMADIAPAQSVFSNALEILNRAVRERAFPGAVLAVGHSDQQWIVTVGRFMYAENAPAVQSDTIYDLASLTKVVATTTAAMIMVERRALVLDKPVAFYLPDFFPPYDLATDALWEARREVTVRHLLAHTSGLPAYEQFFLRAREKFHVLEEALQVPLEELPGTRTLYSDVGFILLGEIIERVSKQSLDRFCGDEIFTPLEMTHTCFNPPEAWRERIAPTELDERFRKRLIQGEVHDENAWVMGGVAGHSGLFGTAGDLSRFCRMMLKGGRMGEKQLMSPDIIQEFTQPCPAAKGAPRALGWDKPIEPSSSGRYFSPGSYGHLGYTGTSVWIDPDKELFVILLTNRVHPSRANDAIKKIRPAIHDAVIEALAPDK
ncbi:MAG: beta-lactamase family protein [Acidobacteria bacterium]|nr:beta-lactamase family protein [Acidobacteriota bacterium]